MNPGLEPRLPLYYDVGNGPYAMITQTDEMIQQDLKILFMTNPGEKLMDIYFGIGIQGFLFENKNASFQGKLQENITKQINKYMPYIRINSINSDQQDNTFFLSMKYGINSTRAGLSEFNLVLPI